ncbi:MAG: hypothetical protein AB8B83_09490 [Bdellovibrionales bacterium]
MTEPEVNYPDNVAIVSSEHELLTRQFTMAHNVILLPRKIPLQEEFVKMASAIRIFAQQKFAAQRKYIGHELHSEVSVGDEDEHFWGTKNGSKISWASFDNFVEQQKDASVIKAAKFIRADCRILTSSVLRIHWQDNTISQDEHPDSSGNIQFGRALTCYSEPTTRGWQISQQVIKPNGDQGVKMGEEDNFFAFRRGDLWRHACESMYVGKDIDFAVPFVHKAPFLENDIPRMLLLG